MLYFAYVNSRLTAVGTEPVKGATNINRNDFTNLAHADEIASEATALTGELHVAVDQGAHTSPRYDVIAAPRVGAEVSRAFNGDYYPAGKIVRVSSSLRRVETEDGTVFYRVRQSASWRADGTWYMSSGRRDERNPSF